LFKRTGDLGEGQSGIDGLRASGIRLDTQLPCESAIIAASAAITGAGPPEANAVAATARVNVIISVSDGGANAVGGARQAVS